MRAERVKQVKQWIAEHLAASKALGPDPIDVLQAEVARLQGAMMHAGNHIDLLAGELKQARAILEQPPAPICPECGQMVCTEVTATSARCLDTVPGPGGLRDECRWRGTFAEAQAAAFRKAMEAQP